MPAEYLILIIGKEGIVALKNDFRIKVDVDSAAGRWPLDHRPGNAFIIEW